ncbi:hypothetical protein FHT98_4375 [Bosea sp. AK1]|nr:hypothetical protein [Bosea sp. AK1]TQI76578.1 hypothetical protein FHT98_4375 [Bosea sp. AK1]
MSPLREHFPLFATPDMDARHKVDDDGRVSMVAAVIPRLFEVRE